MAGGNLFLGVDGGATRCRARIRTQAGDVLAEAAGPPANVYFDFDKAMATIETTVAEVLANARLGNGDLPRIEAGFGIAGVSVKADEKRVASRFSAFGGVRVANDAVTACLGAHAGEDGGVVIAGTGSAAMALVEGRSTVIGGRGFLLGDAGSAARIGQDGLRRALLAHDGIEAATPLTRQLMARFGDDPKAMVDWALTARPGDYGAFAPLVLAAAEDPVGRAVAEAAGKAIAALGFAVRRLGAIRIAVVGGLAEPIASFLPPSAAGLFSPPLFDATDGAILLAGGSLTGASPAQRS